MRLRNILQAASLTGVSGGLSLSAAPAVSNRCSCRPEVEFSLHRLLLPPARLVFLHLLCRPLAVASSRPAVAAAVGSSRFLPPVERLVPQALHRVVASLGPQPAPSVPPAASSDRPQHFFLRCVLMIPAASSSAQGAGAGPAGAAFGAAASAQSGSASDNLDCHFLCRCRMRVRGRACLLKPFSSRDQACRTCLEQLPYPTEAFQSSKTGPGAARRRRR